MDFKHFIAKNTNDSSSKPSFAKNCIILIDLLLEEMKLEASDEIVFQFREKSVPLSLFGCFSTVMISARRTRPTILYMLILPHVGIFGCVFLEAEAKPGFMTEKRVSF